MSGRVSFTEHARSEARRRGISEETVLEIARAPEQRIAGRSGREIRQSRVFDPASGKLHLVRVVIESGQEGDMIVTVYRSSQIRRYWSKQ
jgi:hypothetical protein